MAHAKHAGLSVVVIDDDPYTHASLERDLRSPEIKQIFLCETAEECFEVLDQHHPDIAVVDLSLEGEMDGGVRLVREIKQRDSRVRCVVVAGGDPRGTYLMEAILAGAQGYSRKGYAKDQLSTLVTRLAAGEVTIDPNLAFVMLDYLKHPHGARKPRLAPRQREVLELINEGRSNAEIAQALTISIKTVKTYVSQIMVAYNVAGKGGRERIRVLSQVLPDPPESPNR